MTKFFPCLALPCHVGMLTLALLIVSPSRSFAEIPTLNLGLVNVENSYVLGAGDRIKIVVINEPEYGGEQQILVDGTITMPLAGTVPVQGMTLAKASALLETRLASFLKYPNVTVSLMNSRTFRIQVLGAVNRPGSYSVAPNRGQTGATEVTAAGASTLQENVPRLTQLIQLAGGITPLADIRTIEIRRVLASGDKQILPVNLWELLQGNVSQGDPFVQDSDTIWVPTAQSIDPQQQSLVSTANFAPSEMLISVIGEVQKPGQLTVTPRTSLTGGILAAGGFTPKAESTQVQLIRLNANGSVESRDVPFNMAQGLDEQLNPLLRSGDVLVVKPNASALAGDNLQVGLNPFNLLLQPLISLGNLWRVVDILGR